MTMEKCYDYGALTGVWLASVRATHDFLSDEDLDYYHRRLPHDYLPNVETYAVRDESGEWCAFVGLSTEMIEMLFVRPDIMGQGYGSLLLDFAVRDKGMRKVDVNEQNARALSFYLRRGFVVRGRDALDGKGKPYPILHLEML